MTTGLIEAKKTDVDTIIISDIHLGSKVARPKEIKAILQSYEFKSLILLGLFHKV